MHGCINLENPYACTRWGYRTFRSVPLRARPFCFINWYF
jgi:hypothetical protein